MKNIGIFNLKIFIFWWYNFSLYLNRHVFIMDSSTLNVQTGPFPIEGGVASYYYYHILQKFLYFM